MAEQSHDMELNARATLGQCRHQIDRVDRAIARLLRERARLALRAGRIKLAAGEPLTAPERETAVLARVREFGGMPLEGDRLVRIFQTIIDETRGTEHQWLGRVAEGAEDDIR